MELTWIVLIYLAVIFVVGILCGKKIKGFDDFIIGGGKFGIIILVGTVIATQWGGGSFLGISGYGYESLYRGVWYALSAIPRFLIWAFLLAIVMRRVKPYTISEWFTLRYDSKSGMLVSVLNILMGIGLIGVQFVAFGNIVQTYMNFDLTTSIIIGALIVGIYTTVGGLVGEAITDVVQLGVMVLSVFGVLGACIAKVGTFSAVREVLPASHFDPVNPYGVFFFITIFMLWMADIPSQYVIQRISSAKNYKVVFWGAASGAISYALLAYLTPAIGTYAKVLLPNLERPDLAYPSLIIEVLPPVLAGLAIAGLMAAVMSTADSYLLAPATLIANDFFRLVKPNATQKQSLLVARLFTIVYIALGLIAALIVKVILTLGLTFLAIGMAMLPAFIASVTWKKATNLASFWSMLIGGIINIYVSMFPPEILKQTGYAGYYFGWIGFAVALILLIVISLVKPEKGKLKFSERELIERITV
jgi:SSS family solute:Na+ symporter